MANFDDQLNNISRRRAMADMLSKQGRGLQSQLGQTQYAGGYAIPTQGVESANAILSQLLGAYFDNKYAKEEAETKEKQREDMKQWAMMLNEVGKPSEIQPVTVGYGPSPERLSPEVKAGIDATNQGAQDIMVEDKQRQQNEVMAHLLSGLDKGGYAAQIAGTQLANQLSPMERKPVSGVPGVTMDSRGNFYDTSGNMLSSQQVQEIAQQMRKSSATSVTTNVGGATDILELATKIAENNPTITFGEAMQQATAAAAGQGLPSGGSAPAQPAQPPQAQAAPSPQVEAAQPEVAEPSNPLSAKYIRNGELTGYGRQVMENLIDPDKQKEISDAAANNALLLQDVELIAQVVDQGGWYGGPLLGMDVVQGAQLIADQLGLGAEQASEVRAALRRLQTAGKIQMIDEAGGVRAFDTVQEMQSLFESLANEKMDKPTLLNALDKFRQRAYRSIGTANNLSQFVNDAGASWAYPFDVTYPEPYVPQQGETPSAADFWK